jgi:ABC-type branched-subunit amino acid transport system ATPase component
MNLNLTQIRKTFGGVHAVDGVSLEFLPGKISGIIGPNGSGKTTLMNCISGFIKWDSGVLLVGENVRREHINSYEARDVGISRTFQNVRVFEQMTVLDNILVVITKRGVLDSFFSKANDYQMQQAQEILKKVGLISKQDNQARDLSYGQRKLLEIGRALATDTQVVLFDEPFAGLFPEMIDSVMALMKELRALGKTVILIEHNMYIMRTLCDYLVVMDTGKVLAEGNPFEVLNKQEVKLAYLGE